MFFTLLFRYEYDEKEEKRAIFTAPKRFEMNKKKGAATVI